MYKIQETKKNNRNKILDENLISTLVIYKGYSKGYLLLHYSQKGRSLSHSIDAIFFFRPRFIFFFHFRFSFQCPQLRLIILEDLVVGEGEKYEKRSRTEYQHFSHFISPKRIFFFLLFVSFVSIQQTMDCWSLLTPFNRTLKPWALVKKWKMKKKKNCTNRFSSDGGDLSFASWSTIFSTDNRVCFNWGK